MGDFTISVGEWRTDCYNATISRLGCEVWEFDGMSPDEVFLKAIRWVEVEILKENQT